MKCNVAAGYCEKNRPGLSGHKEAESCEWGEVHVQPYAGAVFNSKCFFFKFCHMHEIDTLLILWFFFLRPRKPDGIWMVE